MRESMVGAHHALPTTIDGAHRYSDPWFRALIHHIYRGELGFEEAALHAGDHATLDG